MNFINSIKPHLPTILTIGACTGAVATTAFAIKNTIDAHDDICDYMNSENDSKKIKDVVKHYIPTGMALLATLGCCIGSNVVHTKQINTAIATLLSTASAITMAREGKNELEYRKIEEVHSGEYMNPPYELNDDEFVWVFEDFRNNQHDARAGWFRIKRIDLVSAEYDINRLFILKGEAKLTEFYDFIKKEAEYSGYKMDDDFGKYFAEANCDLIWSEYFEAEDGYRWIDFYEKEIYTKDGKLSHIILSYPFEPRLDLSECEYPTDEDI